MLPDKNFTVQLEDGSWMPATRNLFVLDTESPTHYGKYRFVPITEAQRDQQMLLYDEWQTAEGHHVCRNHYKPHAGRSDDAAIETARIAHKAYCDEVEASQDSSVRNDEAAHSAAEALFRSLHQVQSFRTSLSAPHHLPLAFGFHSAYLTTSDPEEACSRSFRLLESRDMYLKAWIHRHGAVRLLGPFSPSQETRVRDSRQAMDDAKKTIECLKASQASSEEIGKAENAWWEAEGAVRAAGEEILKTYLASWAQTLKTAEEATRQAEALPLEDYARVMRGYARYSLGLLSKDTEEEKVELEGANEAVAAIS